MTRLLLLCEYPTLLGGERSMLSVLPHVRAAGVEVVIAAPPTGPLRKAIGALGVEHVPLEVRDRQGVRRPLGEIRSEMAACCRHVRPGLVHPNSLSMGRIAGPVVADERLPSIAHLRDIVRVSRAAARDLNRNTRLVAVSRATRDFHVAQGLDASRMIVLHNGVDLRRAVHRSGSSIGVSRPNLVANPPVGGPTITTVGQLGMRKGVDRILAAAEIVLDKLPNAHFLLVGARTSDKKEARDFERRLRTTASAPSLAGRVHFLGTRTDVQEILANSTLLVHAARQEPLGRVLLEAAASGLPIVATDVGGTREIFPRDCEAALLINDQHPDATVAGDLAAAILQVTGDPAMANRLGTNARRRIAACFREEYAAKKLVRVYRSIL